MFSGRFDGYMLFNFFVWFRARPITKPVGNQSILSKLL